MRSYNFLFLSDPQLESCALCVLWHGSGLECLIFIVSRWNSVRRAIPGFVRSSSLRPLMAMRTHTHSHGGEPCNHDHSPPASQHSHSAQHHGHSHSHSHGGVPCGHSHGPEISDKDLDRGVHIESSEMKIYLPKGALCSCSLCC